METSQWFQRRCRLKMWTDARRRMPDGGTDAGRTMDDGRRAITKAHPEHMLRWAKNVQYMYQFISTCLQPCSNCIVSMHPWTWFYDYVLTRTMVTNRNNKRGWLVVVSSFFVRFLTDGLVFSFGILYIEFLDEFQDTRAVTAFTGALATGVMNLSGKQLSFLILTLARQINCFLPNFSSASTFKVL